MIRFGCYDIPQKGISKEKTLVSEAVQSALRLCAQGLHRANLAPLPAITGRHHGRRNGNFDFYLILSFTMLAHLTQGRRGVSNALGSCQDRVQKWSPVHRLQLIR